MMSGMPLETCWAFNERWNNKFYYKFASCWLFLLSKRQKFGMCSGDCIAWWLVVEVRIYIVVMTLWSLLRCCRRLKFGLWSAGFWHRVFWLVATIAYQTARYQSRNDHDPHFHRSASLEFRRPVSTAYKRHSPCGATYDCCSRCCSVRSRYTNWDIACSFSHVWGPHNKHV